MNSEKGIVMGDLLAGRVAIVTGAGRGIGAGIARLLASEGARVVVNDLGVEVDGSGTNVDPAAQLAEEITAAGGEAIANSADIADFEAADSLIRCAIEKFGQLDVLVNVAGILRDRMIFNMSEDDWDAVIRVHLKGTFNTCRHASVHWRSLRDPAAHNRIINFTSGAGMHGAPGQPNYAAAKLGIVGLTYSLANSLRQYGVTANAIAPVASTRMTQSIPGGRRRQTLSDDDPQRSPANIAPSVAYLASTGSDWCTGQVIFSRGYEIGLYNVPAIIRLVGSPGPWDVETAFRMMEQTFKPAVPAPPA
jgi:NAD(P)-dependent dehydrogenase (short-subunit alcohol dehydrogenase family)